MNSWSSLKEKWVAIQLRVMAWRYVVRESSLTHTSNLIKMNRIVRKMNRSLHWRLVGGSRWKVIATATKCNRSECVCVQRSRHQQVANHKIRNADRDELKKFFVCRTYWANIVLCQHYGPITAGSIGLWFRGSEQQNRFTGPMAWIRPSQWLIVTRLYFLFPRILDQFDLVSLIDAQVTSAGKQFLVRSQYVRWAL